MALLRRAHADVGGEIVSAGGTGTHDLHAETGVTEIQAGSYALMDTHYGTLGLPFDQALHVLGTVISVCAELGGRRRRAQGARDGSRQPVDRRWRGVVLLRRARHVLALRGRPRVGDRVRVVPAHIDPTMAMHEAAWITSGDEVIDRWPIDLRGW